MPAARRAVRLPDGNARRSGIGPLGSISVATVAHAEVEVFYWIAITFSQTLGTALGDWTADATGLGYDGGALLFAAALAVLVAGSIF